MTHPDLRGLAALLTILLFAAGCSSPETNKASDSSTSMGMEAADSNSPPAPGEMVMVTVADDGFHPSMITASLGGGAHFENQGQRTHEVIVTDAEGAVVFDHTLAPGESYHFPPANAGDYDVACKIHPSMTARLHVQSP